MKYIKEKVFKYVILQFYKVKAPPIIDIARPFYGVIRSAIENINIKKPVSKKETGQKTKNFQRSICY